MKTKIELNEPVANRGYSIRFSNMSPEDIKTLEEIVKFLEGRPVIKDRENDTIIVEFWSNNETSIKEAAFNVKYSFPHAEFNY